MQSSLSTLVSAYDIPSIKNRLYIPINNFSVMFGQFPVFLGRTSTKHRSRTEDSASVDSLTSDPLISSLTLYHCAPPQMQNVELQ